MNGPPDHLLVIGAQKCGTTTLWEDLKRQPEVAVSEKESEALLGPGADPAVLRARVEGEFARQPGRVRATVTTVYSMLPLHPEVVANARAVLPQAQVCYLVRDPIQRAVSHHHHDFALGLTGPDVDLEVRRHRSLLDHSRYATQLRPWLEAYGREQVVVVRFEDYVTHRHAELERLLARFAVAATDPGTAVHNAHDDKRVATGGWRRLAQHPAYRRWLRPLASEGLRRRLGRSLLPAAPPRPAAPSAETLAWLADQLRPEVAALAELTGSAPLWDLDATVARLTEGSG